MTDLADIVPFDPSLPELIADPYAIFAQIGESASFHGKLGYWVIRELMRLWRESFLFRGATRLEARWS